MNEAELKEEAKRLLGNLGIHEVERFLEHHFVDEAESGDVQGELEDLVRNLSNPDNVPVYEYFFDLAKEERLKEIPTADQGKVISNISVALNYAVDLPLDVVVDTLASSRERFPEERTEGLSGYWCRYFELTYDSIDRKGIDTKRVMRNLAELPLVDMYELWDKHICLDGNKNESAEGYALQLLNNDDFSFGALMTSVSVGEEMIGVYDYLREHDRRITELDPKMEQIDSISKIFHDSAYLGKLFDFSEIPELTAPEFAAFIKLINAAAQKDTEDRKDLKLIFNELKRQKQKFQRYRTAPLTGAAQLFNNITGADLFAEDEFAGVDVDEVLAEDNLFQFYLQLAERFPKQDIFFAVTPIAENALPLYIANKIGLMTPDGLAEIVKGASTADEITDSFYDDCFNLAYVFSFGKDVKATIVNQCYSYDVAARISILNEDYLESLIALRRHSDNYTEELNYLLRVAEASIASFADSEGEAAIVTELANGFAEDRNAARLVIGAAKEVHSLFRRCSTWSGGGNLGAPLSVSKRLMQASADFEEMLADSCDENEIQQEYKGWLEIVSAAGNLKEFDALCSLDSPYARNVFLKYNAPANFEEQCPVVETLITAVCGKELPVARKPVDNLAMEIPFGGGVTVHLPGEVNLYKAKRDNAWFYNLLGFLYGGMHRYNSFVLKQETLQGLAAARVPDAEVNSLVDYFDLFSNYGLAESIFIAAEQTRIFSHLVKDLPGLKGRIKDYFNVRKSAGEKTSFSHPSEELVFSAYVNYMLGEKAGEEALLGEAVNAVGEVLATTAQAPTVEDALKLLDPMYKLVEEACKVSGNPVPERERKTIDPRILEEILRANMEGKEIVFESGRMGPYHRYHEFNPDGEVIVTVFEDVVPARVNKKIEALLEERKVEVASMQEQLVALAPQDVYIARNRLQGKLDRRALQRYHRDLQLGKVPNPRVCAKKIVEKRDVAAILAINMNSIINKPVDGVAPRQVMQEMMAAFLEGSRMLDDTIGIYGFTSRGKDNTVVYVFKDIHEPLTDDAYYRLAFVAGREGNRNGAAYRHFTRRLSEVDAMKKYFIELCPNYRPADLGYKGEIAVKDSALAVNGMRLSGVNPICMCLGDDPESRENLEAVFGQGSYVLTKPKTIFSDLTKVYGQFES